MEQSKDREIIMAYAESHTIKGNTPEEIAAEIQALHGLDIKRLLPFNSID